MQFFPAEAVSSTSVNNSLYSGTGSMSNSADTSFNNMLSSFIEEDRYDYSGRPPGFAAYGPQSGTLDNNTADKVIAELRKRNVSELSISQLESLAASGTPMTIGTMFNALAGKSRLTEELSDEEGIDFKFLLNKLGFSKSEQDELLGLSHDGDTSGLMQRLSAKLQSLEEPVDITKKEWSLLLKALDASPDLKKGLLGFFANGDDASIDGKTLDTMLNGVRTERAEREQAASHAAKHMRGAVVDSLEAARAEQMNKAVEDKRGSRELDQKEALMQNSMRKNTGVDELKREADADMDGNAEHGFNRRDGKSRAESDLEWDADAGFFKGKAGREEDASGKTASLDSAKGVSKKGPADTLLQRVSAAPNAHSALDVNQPLTAQGSPAQNLNNIARDYRQEIFSQVEQGILSGMQNGSNRLTLQLNPVELGAVTVVLSMHQGEVKATIRADQPESASLLREQMAELKTALEAEGLKVKELDVQTSLREDPAANQWEGHKEHNLLRDAEARDRMTRLARMRREEGAPAENGATLESAAPAARNNGLHIVA